MKIQKPDWTPLELSKKTARHRELMGETMNHEDDCQCNRCMECFGLGELTALFTEDEHVAAILAAREKQQRENDS